MNVVMPTATSTMHTDSNLAAASTKTAERGLKVLKSLLDNPTVRDNCKAIYAASSGEETAMDSVHSNLVEVSAGISPLPGDVEIHWPPLTVTLPLYFVVLDGILCETSIQGAAAKSHCRRLCRIIGLLIARQCIWSCGVIRDVTVIHLSVKESIVVFFSVHELLANVFNYGISVLRIC